MKLFLNIKPKQIAESAINKQQQVIDEIDEIEQLIDANVSTEIKIPKDVINSFQIKDTLNPEVWINDNLNPKVKTHLLVIAKDFFKDLELPKEIKIKDIIFTGSLANFNWSKFSDIDLHIVVDLNQFNADPQMVEDYFFAQKSIWNNEHDIEVFNFPVEVYVQDVNAKLRATAIYSVVYDKWILKPTRETFKVDKKSIKNKAHQFIHYLRDVRQLYQDKNYKAAGDLATKIKEKINHMRNSGLEKGGEFSLENLVFKVLRRTTFMDQLSSFKSKSYDNLMSIDEEKELTIEEYGPKAFNKCDCCKYFDFNMLEEWYGGYNHPIYFAIEKNKEESLEFISPQEYLEECAYEAGMSYEEYTKIGGGVSEKYKEFAQRMLNGEKAPIGFYTRNQPSQEGRHRAMAAIELGCKKIPVIIIRKLTELDAKELALDYKNMSREELNTAYKEWGYKGITDLDWRTLQNYIKHRLNV